MTKYLAAEWRTNSKQGEVARARFSGLSGSYQEVSTIDSQLIPPAATVEQHHEQMQPTLRDGCRGRLPEGPHKDKSLPLLQLNLAPHRRLYGLDHLVRAVRKWPCLVVNNDLRLDVEPIHRPSSCLSL